MAAYVPPHLRNAQSQSVPAFQPNRTGAMAPAPLKPLFTSTSKPIQDSSKKIRPPSPIVQGAWRQKMNKELVTSATAPTTKPVLLQSALMPQLFNPLVSKDVDQDDNESVDSNYCQENTMTDCYDDFNYTTDRLLQQWEEVEKRLEYEFGYERVDRFKTRWFEEHYSPYGFWTLKIKHYNLEKFIKDSYLSLGGVPTPP